MKQRIQIATFVAFATLLVAACGPKSDLPGFNKTESGLHYQFLSENADAQQVQMNDVLVCELAMVFGDDTLYSNPGRPRALLQATDKQFDGSLEEGLLMMHKGDKAIFAIEADSLALFHADKMPAGYQQGKGQKMYYTINLTDIISADSMARAESLFLEEMQQRQLQEPQLLEQYLKDNQIKEQPADDGLIVVMNKRGAGAKIKVGSNVKFNYTGKLLDGTIFDSNIERVAKEAGIYDAQRPYEPEEFTMGQANYVRGLIEGMEGKQKGSQFTLIIPSTLGYGSEGRGSKIQPYSTLVFDIDIVSVN